MPEPRPRKRRQSPANDHNLNNAAPVFTTLVKVLAITDSDAVRNFYTRRFECIQQQTCRVIAKDFIKVLCPKKQASNPHTKGDSSAPAWWPKEKVQHVEPDHLTRLPPTDLQLQKIRSLAVTVACLEIVAMCSLEAFFGNEIDPKYKKKKVITRELFRVANMEARYKSNKIGQVFICCYPATRCNVEFVRDADQLHVSR
ncbi:hypothetical protein C8A05DRAFT_19868 [Staphylotrichum tortipilum]|uniref:Subtelomeric hrmA-associated cluster protein AFUB-079030/YDR124W-like helical bundle domain-containing protein n=1 Tax=Staphylotrichum tortipilum TaxID=2831512 RepID=A0AAN6RP66_9PEZI|nr:hypothetical protein C8A05DRAFT_19868 [Staphylotrichum longicolle]